MTSDAPLPVIIVSYNTCALLRDCLASLRTATLPLRPIVVDNASSDGSAAMVAAQFPEVELIAAGENLGFARANNLGLERVLSSAAEYCLLLNPDAQLTAGALEQLVAFLAAHPRVGMVAPRLLYADGSFQAAAFRFPTLLMALFDIWPPREPGLGRLYHHPLNGRYPQDGGAVPFAIEHPLGAAMLVRVATVREVGGFDQALWLYAEEVEWCWRMRQAGWAIWQEPRATVVHIGGASSQQFRTRSFLALHRARQQLFQRIYGPGWNRRYRALLQVAALLKTLGALRAWRRGQIDGAELRRQTWAWGQLPRLHQATVEASHNN